LSHEKKAFVLGTQALDALKTETGKEGYDESGTVIGEGCQTEVNKNRLTLMRKSELTRIPECRHIKFSDESFSSIDLQNISLLSLSGL
jgi:hypothetical protein